MTPSAKQSYKAYSQANHTLPKTRQIVMLYDGIIRNLQQAADAMQHKRIEERFNKLVRASEIIIGLQSCLDFDQGQETAKILYDFYSRLDSRIFALHRSNDVAACEALIAEIKEMRTFWDGVDRIDQKVEASAPSAAEQMNVPPENAAPTTDNSFSSNGSVTVSA